MSPPLDGANGGAIDCKRVGIWYFGLLSFLHFWVGFYIWAMGGLGHQDFLKHLESQKVSLDLQESKGTSKGKPSLFNTAPIKIFSRPKIRLPGTLSQNYLKKQPSKSNTITINSHYKV